MDEELNQGRLIPVDIESEMKKSYIAYSMAVIVGRALPDVRDGLKPVHRRILYTLFENGLFPDKAYRKAADTVGSVLGRYHPHGDASVYDAMVRMAQDFSLRYPLIDGHGNFGSVDGDPAAAYRYTEARMSKAAMAMVQDIDKETVDFVPNFDDRLKEPSVLPSRFPSLLVNGSTGIAVGMATNIPPHNMREVIDGVCCLIDNPDATLDQLMEHIKGPDFPTGGIIMGRSGIRAAYATGRGRLQVRARVEIEEMKNGRERLVVTEIPYGVNKARLIESIADLVKEKRIEMISDLRDESDRDGMRIVIELKREANAAVVLNQLYTFSQLQDTFGVIMLALVNGEPKIMSLKEILQHYLRFQEEIIVRRTRYDLRRAEERAHILEGLSRAIDIVDEIIAAIRACKGGQAEAKTAIMEKFGFDDPQAAAIVAFRLGQLAGLEIKKITGELNELQEKIQNWREILADEKKVLAIIKDEISVYREKFGDARRTEIAMVSGEVDIEDLIPVEDCVITLTHFGYIKRMPMDTYRTQRRGGRGISGLTQREEDFVSNLFICSSHDYILFFTSAGRVYRLKGYEIGEGSRSWKGVNIVNLLPLEKGETVTSTIRVGEFEEGKYLSMITKNGIIKRTDLSSFKNVRKSGLIAINLDEGDQLGWVLMTGGDQQLVVATRQGLAIRFSETDARELGRTARGVKAISLEEGDEVVGAAIVANEGALLTVSESGLGRRTDFDQYRLQTRGGKGIRNYYTDKNGPVAGVRMAGDGDDIVMITDDGVIIRIAAGEVTKQSRYGGGVRVMRIAEGSRVVTLAIAPSEETGDEPQAQEDAEENGVETECSDSQE
ncbi:MAG TPA: DNA gyrase subunit A [Candidatus Fimivivens faecavium]|nr:DNA gyrase subunit A [Candidatus Fimivivens faecavium]